MARNAPVPLYSSNVSEGAGLGGDTMRRLQSASPGTTDSTATTLPAASVLAATRGYLVGEAAAHSSAYSGDGVFRGIGWVFSAAQAIAAGFITLSSDGYSIAAGTWTVPVHYSRAGGLLTGNVDLTCYVNIYRANNYATGAGVTHIGAATANFTATTTEQSTNINVVGAAVALDPADNIVLEIFWENTAALTSDVSRCRTNSTTALRISAIPQYTRQYGRALADSAPATDAITRNAAYARRLADSAPASDSLGRIATYARTVGDTAPAVGDALLRVFTANRALADAPPAVGDVLTRYASYNRRLADSAPVSDSVTRRATYARQLLDTLSSGGGTIIKRIKRFLVYDKA